MPKYVWAAKDNLGKTVLRELTADSSANAKSILVQEGLTDLELVEDEIVTAAASGFSEKTVLFGEEIKSTAADRLKHRNMPKQTFFRVIRDMLREDTQYFLLVGLVIGMQLYAGRKTGAMVMAVLGSIWPLFRIWVALPGIYYARLNEAKDWHRWSEVLEVIDTSWKIRRFHFIRLPASELGRSRAQALVGLGQLPEGLAELQQWQGVPEMPNWLYTAHLAGLYDLAKLHDKALEHTLEAIREQPAQAMYIDLMNRYVRYKKDPVKAREALGLIEKDVMTELVKPFYARCLGILAYLEGDYVTARRELETALEMMQRTVNQPFREGNMNVAKAYLCCVHAKLGDLVSARKNFEEARKYLVATDEAELLGDCERALKG